MLDFVLNFLFPPVCGVCGKINKNWLCNKCKKRLEKYEKFEIVIGKEKIIKLFKFSKQNEIEKDNKKLKIIESKNEENNYERIVYFDELLYCFEYTNLVRTLLLKYKFSDCGYLSNLFVNVMLNNEKMNKIFENYDMMIPVPMDKTKKSQRGYNQTELITKSLEKNIKLKNNYKCNKQNLKNHNCKLVINNKCLLKIKKNKTQSTLNAEKRMENIKNAFLVRDKNEIRNKSIILFDDIVTTGATANEISKILKEAGARKILVLVIAKD